ncbi:tRNA (5-methylaminomethyl-2-thiouridine)(34)-methyltransferase MnmD [Stappia sp.]|uniref:tRNA (5-methylaminomethyl-2-thiouridine)(34)-methyltransferase MnmD n=1 Tax=Stappia sp. TaxID=1870903 RepID=UPI0032D9A211
MPFSTRFGDHFYARADGRAECRHVFLAGNGLPERWRHLGPGERFVIAELGFGTGLNVAETWRQWRETAPEGAHLKIVSFEAHPMETQEMARALAAWPDLAAEASALAARWATLSPLPRVWDLDAHTALEVRVGMAEETVPVWEGAADAWYLDGFAPSRNPQMWSAELMRAVAVRTRPQGTFATYTAAGWVRRNLIAAGFEVDRRPGFAGKREMMAGRLPATCLPANS